MSEQKTHYKKLINPEYLGEYEFQPGEEKLVTIKAIDVNEITGTGGKKEDRPVMHFHEQVKPLILNSTNFKTLTKLFQSPYIEDWAGRQITLYGDPTVKFGGEIVGGVRIRKELPVATSEACADCGQFVQAADKYSAQQVEAATVKRYGVALCWECARARKEAAGAAG